MHVFNLSPPHCIHICLMQLSLSRVRLGTLFISATSLVEKKESERKRERKINRKKEIEKSRAMQISYRDGKGKTKRANIIKFTKSKNSERIIFFLIFYQLLLANSAPTYGNNCGIRLWNAKYALHTSDIDIRQRQRQRGRKYKSSTTIDQIMPNNDIYRNITEP